MTLGWVLLLTFVGYTVWWVLSRMVVGYLIESSVMKDDEMFDILVLAPILAELIGLMWVTGQVIGLVNQGLEKFETWITKIDKSPVTYGRRVYRYFHATIEDSKSSD